MKCTTTIKKAGKNRAYLQAILFILQYNYKNSFANSVII